MKRLKSKTPDVDPVRVHAAALKVVTALMIRWLPDGQISRKYWVAKCPGLDGNQRPQLRVNLRTGRWTDFRTGNRGSDVITLAAYVADIDEAKASAALAAMLGVS